MKFSAFRKIAGRGTGVWEQSYDDCQIKFQGPLLCDPVKSIPVSKQSMSYLTDYLERRGYVEACNHETDKRATVFRLTAKGIACKNKTMEILADSCRMGKQTGRRKMKQLQQLLLNRMKY